MRVYPLLVFFICLSKLGFSQQKLDSLLPKLDPQRYARVVSEKSKKLENKLVSKTAQVLKKMERSEKKVYQKLLKGKDSLLAKSKLEEIRVKYAAFKDNSLLEKSTQYIPKLDSLTTSLKFLSINNISGNIPSALAQTNSLQDQFNQAEYIRKFIRERKEQLKQVLEKTGLVKNLKKLNKTVYYYSAQIREYREMFKDPKKIERKVLDLLGKTKVWKEFMNRNSLFASLFRTNYDAGDPLSQVGLAGLQTRLQVTNLIQQQIATGGPNAQQQINQNIQAAQNQLAALKSKIIKTGSGSSDMEQPDFKVNSQKTKSFFKRLEYGTNFQTQKASNFFPITTDIGFSVGYKLNDNSIIGIGTSYKLGLGRGWNAIRFTNEGLGIRSYIDLKLKSSFWISGGYEQNYKAAFNDFQQLRDKNAWQKSGLIGLSKVFSLKTKLFKKTSIKLLWDFLSYQQIPRTEAFVFRVGYNF